jgi:predicted 2-oxoglutarate/Fe(II)-dependent dioxygenase YbiX
MNKLTDYIKVYKNGIPNDLCNRIIDEYKTTNGWQDAQVGSGLVNKDIRNVRNINISHPETIQYNQEIRRNLDKDIYDVVANILASYTEIAPHTTIVQDSGYILLEYSEGCFYSQHTDHFLTDPRSISCSLNLNDDYTGGEFTFFDEKISYNLGKGDVLMFPSNFMYPHSIKPILSGTRYSIITWFN